jgi:hypothetical protein
MNIVKNEMARMGRENAEKSRAYEEQGKVLAAERNAHAATAKTLEAALAELDNLKKQFSLN